MGSTLLPNHLAQLGHCTREEKKRYLAKCIEDSSSKTGSGIYFGNSIPSMQIDSDRKMIHTKIPSEAATSVELVINPRSLAERRIAIISSLIQTIFC